MSPTLFAISCDAREVGGDGNSLLYYSVRVVESKKAVPPDVGVEVGDPRKRGKVGEGRTGR